MTIQTITHKRTNMYLIGNNDKYILYDCLWHDSFPVIKIALKEYNIAFVQIAGVLVSHFHPDHAGTFEFLRHHGVIPLVLEYQMPYIEWLNRFFAKPKNDPTGQYVPINIRTLTPIKHDKLNEILKYCGINGKILHTPGHSDDGISLIAGSTVFVGDLPRLETAEAYGGDVLTSWQEISNNIVKDIYYAHGNTDEDIAAIAKWKEEHFE